MQTRREEFNQLLEVGQKYESIAIEKVIQYHHQRGEEYILSERRNDCRYDFQLTNDEEPFNIITYEVKADLRSKDTGNFYIERSNGQRPSGIFTSDAMFYILTDGDEYYMIPLETLIRLVKPSGKKCKEAPTNRSYKDARTGETYNVVTAIGCLVPKCDIIRLSVRLE